MPGAASAKRRRALGLARRALGVEHILLAIHDASFPCRSDEDTGRGTPYGRGARDLAAWAADLGFTGLQLGPQGETSRDDPSPYDGTAFSKTVLSVSLWALAHDPAWEGALDRALLEEIVGGAPAARVPRGDTRMDYAYVYDAHRRALASALARLDRSGAVWARFLAFRTANARWLDHDARFETAARSHGTDDWERWPSAERTRADAAPDEAFSFGQFVVHEQHALFQRFAESSELRLFGDLQIGVSHRDRLGRDALFLPGYRMGAPPSRTNPLGQPWGYPVLRPGSAEALAFLRARVDKMLGELHGLRIDHPHGLVCPWVYRDTPAEPHDALLRAVQQGARLYESPDLPDHPELARYAIASPSQIDRALPRYADGWVRSLTDAQVAAYARPIEVVFEAARTAGRRAEDVLAEVLSTCPHPLLRVLETRGIGRFRVTQKADPRSPTDVYSTRMARPGDWVMLGNHDTPTIWRCARDWHASDGGARLDAWCAYLAENLGEDAIEREAIAREPSRIAQPMLVDLLSCGAGNVSIFFADLLGSRETYNVPGLVSPDNWTLRAGNDFVDAHRARVARSEALDLPGALAAALRLRGARTNDASLMSLATALEEPDA